MTDDPFAEPLTEDLIYVNPFQRNAIIIPNELPRITAPYRIAIIGEAPGKDEEAQKRPFVGFSGKRLDQFLSAAGVLRDACFIGNICQQRPATSIAEFSWEGPELYSGLGRLTMDLQVFNPNVILLLGGAALHAFKNPTISPKKGRKQGEETFNFPDKIGDWRGSFFISDAASPCPNTKCISSYHPAYCLRDYSASPYLMMDIFRAKKEATTKELILPKRELITEYSFKSINDQLDHLLSTVHTCGTDIEGWWNDISCISFARSDSHSFIVPFTDMSGQNLWSVEEEITLWEKVSAVLGSPSITKVWQNGLYDRFCLEYGYGIMCRGPQRDIMLRHWEQLCELEKSLGVQASIYTNEPFYKQDRKTQDLQTYWKYCCKDSAVTIEIYNKLDRMLQPQSRKHAEFNEGLTNALLYMEKRGIKYDSKEAKKRLNEVEHEIFRLQYELDKITGFGIKTLDRMVLRSLLRAELCYKNDPSRPKKGNEQDLDLCLRTLLGEGDLTEDQIGRISTIIRLSLNIKSKEFKNYLYETLGLPKQYNENKETGIKSITTDYEALITLRRTSSNPILQLAIDITELRTRGQLLRITTDNDGRVRASYNGVGSETGRVACKTSPTGSGFNLQTLPDENELKPETSFMRAGMRDLLVADEGCFLAKCDLRGADGWTVGANLASLGDRTMLDDLLFGLKPASILCYARRHGVGSILNKSRTDLAILCKEVKKSDWDYFAYKQCIWGFCYLMGIRKAAQHVANVSEGTVWVKESDMEQAKQMLFRRYNIQLWHRAMDQKLRKQGYPPQLTSPSGHIRKFFGRPTEILGQALAHEPQSVTTYATNLAVYNCWNDPDNRYRDSNNRIRLRVEPMHQVHDEFLCQFRKEDTSWAVAKIKSWFNNEIVIAGIKITIPFEGVYGTNWSMSEKSKIGSI